MTKIGKEKAQNIGEYTFVLAAIAAALIAMGPYLQRSAQGLIKLSINEIGRHDDTSSMFEIETSNLLYSRLADQADSRSEVKTYQGGKTGFNSTLTITALDTDYSSESSMVDHSGYTPSINSGTADRGLIPIDAGDIAEFNTDSSRIYVSFEGSSLQDD